jgi:acyl-CoA thioester hydrolase
MERGRTNYLRLIGADHRALFEQTEKEAPSFAFVVRSMKIDFLKPAYMDDLLEVRTLSQEVSGASIIIHQKVVRGAEVMVEAEVRVAFVSEGKPRRIPEPLRKAMGADAERNPKR